jgi:hypothetical protein
MKMLHWFNCLLYFINAIMWASIAHMPFIAMAWGAVAVAELFIIRTLVQEG